MTDPDAPGPGGVESLYPFLYAGEGDVDRVLAEVRRSTEEKAAEIVALRETVVASEWPRLSACARDMAARFRDGGRLYVFGNGGSSTDAAAVAMSFLAPESGEPGVPALPLTTDVAVLTALSNDVGFDVVFSRPIAASGRPVDIAMGLSTSGGSGNVLRGFDEATRLGLLTVGFAGYDGGRMAEADTIDYLFVVPSASVHRIQEAQTTLYHLLAELTLAECATAAAG
ncbi:MAG: D-sedoheptulose-7-phosphate isomerase [Actinomycetes bacterium]